MHFFKKLHSCTLERRNGLITISPAMHDKAESWSGLGREHDVVIPEDSPPAATGAALKLAFSRCTG